MRYLAALFVVACGSTPAPVASPPPAPAPAQPFVWLLGDWTNDEGSEHWVAAGGTIYGVALQDGGRFEVMIIDDAATTPKLSALPGGMKVTEFPAETVEARRAVFANSTHDDPKKIEYGLSATGLRATLHPRMITFDWTRGEAARAPALEQADVAFSDAVANGGGVTAWLAAFDENGGMISKGARITGAAIGEMMRPVLESGTLAWKPIASGQRGTIGFTVGKATFTGKTPADGWKSTYVTIWKQQADGGWKVLFDTGRPDKEP